MCLSLRWIILFQNLDNTIYRKMLLNTQVYLRSTSFFIYYANIYGIHLILDYTIVLFYLNDFSHVDVFLVLLPFLERDGRQESKRVHVNRIMLLGLVPREITRLRDEQS